MIYIMVRTCFENHFMNQKMDQNPKMDQNLEMYQSQKIDQIQKWVKFINVAK